MTHKHGYFIAARGDVAELYAHLDIVLPPILTVLDDPEFAVMLKARYPQCDVIWRQNRQYRAHGGVTSNSDADLHAVYKNEPGKTNGSDQFLDERERIMNALGWQRNIFIKLHNETGWSKEALDWQHATTRRAIERRLPVAPGGWAVGNPQVEQIPEALPTLHLASTNRDMVRYILNEYFAAAWMSGFTHDGVTKPGEHLYFTRFIPRDKWPTSMENVTAYHCGRIYQWIKFCHSKGLRVLFGLGEHGPDAVGGEDEGGKIIDAWRKGLKRTGGYEPRFYQGLAEQWKVWWPEWTPGEALAHQLMAGSSRVTYNHPDIVGYCYFTERESSAEWERANTERDRTFKTTVEAYVKAESEPPPVVEPPASPPLILTPFPADNDPRREARRLTARNSGTANVRAQPSVNALVLRTFTLEDAMIIPHELLFDDEQHHDQLPRGGFGYWVPVWLDDGAKGWVRSDAVVEGVMASSRTPPTNGQHPDDSKFVELLVTLINRKRHQWNELGKEIEALELVKRRLEGVEEIIS